MIKNNVGVMCSTGSLSPHVLYSHVFIQNVTHGKTNIKPRTRMGIREHKKSVTNEHLFKIKV